MPQEPATLKPGLRPRIASSAGFRAGKTLRGAQATKHVADTALPRWKPDLPPAASALLGLPQRRSTLPATAGDPEFRPNAVAHPHSLDGGTPLAAVSLSPYPALGQPVERVSRRLQRAAPPPAPRRASGSLAPFAVPLLLLPPYTHTFPKSTDLLSCAYSADEGLPEFEARPGAMSYRRVRLHLQTLQQARKDPQKGASPRRPAGPREDGGRASAAATTCFLIQILTLHWSPLPPRPAAPEEIRTGARGSGLERPRLAGPKGWADQRGLDLAPPPTPPAGSQ